MGAGGLAINRVEGKVAVVTGAASGQGRATAVALAAEGASVVATDINKEALAELSDAVPGLVVRRCDVSVASDVESLVTHCVDRFGRLDAMLNCAGLLRTRPFLEISEEDLDELMAVNVKGVLFGSKYAIPAMQQSGGGSIVNWASVSSMVAEPGIAAYCATKGAVLMLTKGIAIEHAKDNVRANCICPGAVKTPMVTDFFDEGFWADDAAQRAYQPLGIATPEDIANAAVFLVSEESRNMTGSALVIDGGYTAL